jgi:hypothetical protein
MTHHSEFPILVENWQNPPFFFWAYHHSLLLLHKVRLAATINTCGYISPVVGVNYRFLWYGKKLFIVGEVPLPLLGLNHRTINVTAQSI